MARGNGKSEVEPELDSSHELPAGEDEVSAGPEVAGVAASARDSELQKLRLERETLLDRLARLQAEFENARKRAAREQQEFRDFALADAIKTLLPALDSLERALQTSPADKAEGQFRSGVELIARQFRDAMEKLGVKAVPAKGELFDPRVHEAIELVDTTRARDHEVLEELQRGYKLKERLLRPALVKVARNPKH
ncbi:MAG TPA: nucleotide exchange factor GrpE [Terriglobales bacterium]|nr:nucleotide exchange factor GrpE [Terriglobales bacterium]